MKKALNYFACLFIPLAFVMGIFLMTMPTLSKAEETAQVTETAYSSLWINELAGYTNDGASRDGRTGNLLNVSNGGGVAYNNVDPNTEIKMVLKFSSIGRINFCMRATGDAYAAPGNASWENKGYWVRVYKNKQYEFYKGSTKINSSNWPEASYLNTNGLVVDREYTFVFRTINLSDGSVKVSLTRDGYKYFEYIDSEDPILTGNSFAISNTDGSAFSTLGNETISQEAVNVADLAKPSLLSGGNFGSATANADGTVSTVTSSNPSGLAYSFQQNDLYAVKTKFKPSAVAGSVMLSVGSKNGTHAMNRPNVIDATWGWADNGYVATWSANGSASISRNNVTIASCAADANYAFEAEKEYEVSMGVYKLPNGHNRVWLKVDGNLYLVGVDGKETRLNVSVGSSSTQPSALVRTSLVLTSGVDATLSCEKTAFEEKTLAAIDLGSPIGGNAKYDRNGAPTTFSSGIAVVYGNVGSSSIKFNANFTTASCLIAQIRATGTIDTPWGGGWTNRGYCVYVYSNGQAILSKNGKMLCQGFALTTSGYKTATDYLFEIKTVNLGTSALLLEVYCGGNSIIRFVDFVDPILNNGVLSIFSDGAYGSISMVGYEKPTISTSATENEIEVGEEVELSYSIAEPKQEDVVTYYIDETASSAEATISENILTATKSGTIALYTCVNGIYSDNIVLTVDAEPVATVTNLPTQPIIVGGEPYTVDGEIDKGEVLTKVFSIENLTGKADINAETGEITAVAAGNVNVYVTINGTKSQAYLIAISPKIEVKNTQALAVGEVRSLGYEANCELPEETITTTYELINGSEYAELDSATGVVTAKGLGIISIRVIVSGTTFQGVSTVVQIAIEAPVVVLHGVKDMYVGQEITANPQINSGVSVTTKELVIVSGEDVISVEGDKITAKKVGIAKVKAVINGYESKTFEIAVTELVATIIATTMTVNDTQKLYILFNFDGLTINSVTYSIEDGEEFATIEDDILISKSKRGDVLVKAVINADGKEFVAQGLISIVGEVRLVNVSNNTTLLVGTKLQLSYNYLGHDDVDSVVYVLVEGRDIATLSEDGLLEAKKAGTIKLKVVVNDKESEIVTVRIEKVQDSTSGGGSGGNAGSNGNNNGNIATLIIIIASAIVAAVVATATTLFLLKKKKTIVDEVKTDDAKNAESSASSKKEEKAEKTTKSTKKKTTSIKKDAEKKVEAPKTTTKKTTTQKKKTDKGEK